MADPYSLAETMRADSNEGLDRRSRILDGARAAFSRFGFERSSMADIATGAGVSRTAVYHYFPGKEDVLRAVVDELHTASLAEATEAFEKSQTLDAALTGLLGAKFGRALSVISASPHGEELMDASNCLTGSATRTADQGFQALVVKALIRHGRADEAESVADTLIAAAKGLMRSGEAYVSKVQFENRLYRLIGWVTG